MKTVSIYTDTEEEMDDLILGITIVIRVLGHKILTETKGQIVYEPITGWKCRLEYE